MALPLHMLSLFIRIVVSFLIVFLLQFRVNEKSLEERLVSFCEGFFIAKVLDKVSGDTARHLAKEKKTKEQKRKESRRSF